MEIDKEELKFIFKYMPNSELEKFNQYMESVVLAIKINDSPEFVKEVIEDFIKKYPFAKKYLDKMLKKYD